MIDDLLPKKWQPTSAFGARLSSWLHAMIADLPLLVVFVLILTSLVLYVLNAADAPGWRFYGTILALSALLVLNANPKPNETLPEKNAPAGIRFLIVSMLLFLVAFWLSNAPSAIPYIIFLLIGQATWLLSVRWAVLYTAGLIGSFLAILSGDIGVWPALRILPGFIPGVAFTMLFTLQTIRYARQRDRAELLLAELRAANDELREAREQEKALAVAQERVRLARDIHDGLGHHLTVLNVQLQAADKLVQRDPARAAHTIGVCREVAQAALDEVRQSVAALQRSPLDGRSLEEAVATLVRDFGSRTALEATFELHGRPVPLAPAAAMTLYRAAQEGLTNAQKHAAASHVAVTLHYDDQQARLAVRDDGVGLHTNGNGASNGFGLIGLRQRAEHLGGNLNAGTRTDGGFVLELVVPVC